jgi:hypothetical protein
MPAITFKLNTQAPSKRLDLEQGGQLIPVGLAINGIAHIELAAGYQGTAVVTLGGNQGETATFKISQRVGAADVVLADLPNLAITQPSGRSVSFVPFIVQ